MTNPHPLAAWTQRAQLPRQRRPDVENVDDEQAYLELRQRARRKARALRAQRREVDG